MSVISELQVSVNKDEEKMLREQIFKKLFVNLNKGAEGNAIYLWYKEGGDPITRIQLSFNDVMAKGLMEAGFQKIDKNLNAGAGGNNIYLWYYKGSSEYDIPIVNLELTTKAEDEPHMFKEGWKKLSCNLNRQNDGDHIYLWVKKQKTTYIGDIDATTGFGEDVKMFNDGYIRVDEDTNRGVGGLYIFIWYRQTTDPKKAITQLGISTCDAEQKQFQDENYVSVIEDLNQKTGGNAVFLWYKKDGTIPIKAIALLTEPEALKLWESKADNKIKVIKKNLNSGSPGQLLYLCYYQENA